MKKPSLKNQMMHKLRAKLHPHNGKRAGFPSKTGIQAGSVLSAIPANLLSYG